MASGSQNRRRKHKCATTFNDDEFVAFTARCDKAGVTASSFLRCAALSLPMTRAARRPTVDHREVARLSGELGQLAQVLRDLQHLPSTDQHHAALIEDALSELTYLSSATLQALGRSP